MGLIFFSNQLYSFLESQAIEEKPHLDKAIAKAKQIIDESSTKQLSDRQAIAAMKKIYK